MFSVALKGKGKKINPGVLKTSPIKPYLPHNCALKHDKHEESKETVIPILV